MRYSSSDSSPPNTLNRRYELPTCLLEIWTERSPLSDWQSQIVAQNLRFRLRLSEGQRIIQGNQQQISNLITAITSYCDRWLAQDDLINLNHAIEIPQLAKLQLSTLQLFDLYESLERCADEFVILPSLTLEVSRPHWNWLKVIAGAIAIMGVSLGAVRLISNPFGEQPSFQVAVTESPSSPSGSDSQATSIPNTTPNRAESSPQAAIAPKSSAPASKKSELANSVPSGAAATQAPPSNQPNAIASSSPDPSLNKVAAAPAPETFSTARSRSRSPEMESRQAAADQNNNQSSTLGANAKPTPRSSDRILDSASSRAAESSPAPSSPTMRKPEPFNSSPSLISPPPLPQTSSPTTLSGALQVLQVQSDLPSDVLNDFVRYIQLQKLQTSATGLMIINIEINQSQITISNDLSSSTFTDQPAIAELISRIRQWRSPNPSSGKARVIIQINS